MDLQLAMAPGAPDSATVTAGSAATFSLVLDPKGYVGAGSLTCTWNEQQPVGASCTVSPAAVTLNGTDPALFTVNIRTTARSTAAPFGDHRSPLQPSPWARLAVPSLVGLLLLSGVAAMSVRRFKPTVGTPALQWAPLGAAMLAIVLVGGVRGRR